MKFNSIDFSISRRYWLLLAGGSLVLISTLWLVFDLYQKTVAEEILTSFMKAEAVSIQEGNLLTSVAKNQRMLLSSQFVKGIVLLDCGVNPPKQLMILGTGQEIVRCFNQLNSETVSVLSSGFLKTFSAQEIKGQGHLQLVFHIESGFLKSLFLAFSVGFVLILLGIFSFFQNLKKKELFERQRILKNAIASFIDNATGSDVLSEELPDLKDWIVSRKKELVEAQEFAIQAKKQEALVEVAKRIAHDIRSPLQTLGIVLENLNSLPSEKRKMAQLAVNRIYQISKGIVSDPSVPSMDLQKHEKIWVWGLIDKMVLEKKTQYQNKNIDIKASADLSAVSTFVQGDAIEISRCLSNLVDNAVEAISTSGCVNIICEVIERKIQIKIKDTGSGISSEVLSRIGEKGLSIGKNGNGLGVFYAKELAQEMNGNLVIQSQLGVGTEVVFTLPKIDQPEWFTSEIPSCNCIAVLDDDALVHEKIQVTFGERVKVQNFFNTKDLKIWAKEFGGDFVLLSDFDLGGQPVNGIDFIQVQDLQLKSILLTNSYDDLTVQSRAVECGIKIFPKPILEFIHR